LLLLQQVGALERIAEAHSVKLHHIKLHGGLYHATERDEQLANAYLDIVRRWWPRVVVYALAGGTVVGVAKSAELWEEAFLDRNYLDDGTLVPRSERNALLQTRGEVRNHIEQLASGRVMTVSGKTIELKPRTLCIHADTPRAVEFASLAMEKACRGRRPAQ
jgi:UPF0271 protein